MIDYTVDLLIFGISNKKNSNIRELSKKNLSIILVKRNKDPYKNMLVLPGGYVTDNETSEVAANRILEKETGLKDIKLYLSGVNDCVTRDPRGRTVSISYIALVDIEKINQKLIDNSDWYDIDYVANNTHIDIKLSNINNSIFFSLERKTIDKKSKLEKYYLRNERKLGFDHELIITKGLMDLRDKVQNTDIIFDLLPDNFTIGALEQVYENILKEKIINSAFRRKFADKLQITDQKVKTGGHRPSYLYKYNEASLKENQKILEEIIDIYNPETLEKTSEVISKNSAHKLGIWHGSIHLIIVNKEKTKALFQQRASSKDLYPNMWDIAVGGHVAAKETEAYACRRELEEELGLKYDDKEILFIKKYKEELSNKTINSKEIVSMFILYKDIDINNIKLQKEEVKNIKWLTKEEINKLIQEKKTIPHTEEYNLLNDILK